MTKPPRLVFQAKKELRDQLAAVTHADWFAQCLAYVRAEMLESSLTTEQLAGAKIFERTLLNLPDADLEPESFPTTGLNHDLEIIKVDPRQPH